ncbi:hypothetical protein PF006_g11578 [Phytophthora fragariae]|uniref:RNA-directed DNA polymerase n=1 Tax=Phytophthora fragariae TaxID=53985 RepID=A0A6A3TVY1_9STRA|nr:hypothetical protein PF006_g11578 [Phytophthora fragariae]
MCEQDFALEEKGGERSKERDEDNRQIQAVVRRVRAEVMRRDGAKAVISVATTRPAMAAGRYCHSKTSTTDGMAATNLEERDKELSDEAVTSQGTTGDGAPDESEGGRHRHDELPRMEQTLTSEDEINMGSVQRVREATKKARKEAKRQRKQNCEAKRQDTAAKESEIPEPDGAEAESEEASGAVAVSRTSAVGSAEDNEGGEHVAQVRLVKTSGSDAKVLLAEAEDGLPTALMRVAGSLEKVKLDSGARYSVAGTEWMARGKRVHGRAPVQQIEGIGGFRQKVLGLWVFNMHNVYGQRVCVEACVIEGVSNEFLLGVDFMQKHRANLDYETNEVRYRSNEQDVIIPFQTFDENGGTTASVVRMVRKTSVDAESIRRVEVAVAAGDGEQGVVIPKPRDGAALLAAAVTTAHDGKAWVPVLNVVGGRAQLPQKDELGVWIPLTEDMTVLEMNGELRQERVEEWLADLGDTTTPLENEEALQIGTEGETGSKDLIVKLLRAYRELLKDGGACPPATALPVEHHINTGTTAPIMLKRQRHAQTEHEVIDSNVEKMLDAGVVEEGNGSWGFLVVLVKKRDGEVRFCIDYRALNKVTQRDVYPLPRIDETLESLGGALLFSTLDLKAGYWQISVAEEDKDKTAFTTRKGLYRFVRMPFGLANAPSTFQRMMNCVLRGLSWVTCLVYLDDIIVFTKGGVEKHVVELAGVLERLSMAGLTLKAKKCQFATDRMEYLGHELSPAGVRPIERLLTAVQEFPTPRDAVEVKRFVHLAGYYQRFVEGFGSIASPLTELLRKKVEWRWTENQQFAFERLKYLLTAKLLLCYPDFAKPFRLVTDASVVGLGACLMQDFGSGWQPIAYASKVNDTVVAKYAITELECLAVVWAIKLFRPYLYGRPFTIVTDHAALKWLMTSADLAGRLHRWALTLQEYEFTIEYRPGTTNVVADALSRAPQMTAAVRRAVSSTRTWPRVGETASVGEATGTTIMAAATRAVTRAARQREAAAEGAGAATAVERGGGDRTTSGAVEGGTTNGQGVRGGKRKATGPAGGNRRSAKRRAAAVVAAAAERLAEAPEAQLRIGTEPTLQLTDGEIEAAQQKSSLVKQLVREGGYMGMKVSTMYGLVVIDTPHGRRVVLPPALWPVVFTEHHDSVWAGHLRGPQTFARISQIYWWPKMGYEVKRWVAGCQECGSRKARPREVIPPLRSLRGGDVGDRWALDVAGPFPTAKGGERYVIAAVEYVTRYAVAEAVEDHTAGNVAKFLLKHVVLRFGVFRELLTDGAPELTGKIVERLVELLQARQVNPVPYRPQMVGLMERFHRTWKDLVSLYMSEDAQDDWEEWVSFALYAYNSARHTTVGLSPNELMMGRRLRSPNELLRSTGVSEAGKVAEYMTKLQRTLDRCRRSADKARTREQARQAKYYDRRVRNGREFRTGDKVWMFRPPRGPKTTKFGHLWMGLMVVVEPAGYDNFVVRRCDVVGEGEEYIAHVSFLVSYHYPTSLLQQEAADIAQQLEDEAFEAVAADVARPAQATGPAAVPVGAATGVARARTRRRSTRTTGAVRHRWNGEGVEVWRRRRRNKAGNYVLEYRVEPAAGISGAASGPMDDEGGVWLSVGEYERLWTRSKAVEGLGSGDGV